MLFLLEMNDGSLRTTFASETGKYPDCLSEEMEIMSNTFNQVDQIVNDIIEVVVGNKLKYKVEKTVYDLIDSPIKEHIHTYTKGPHTKSNDFNSIGKKDSTIPLKVRLNTYTLVVLCGALIGLVHSPLVQNFMENLVTTLVSSISLPLFSANNI